jgi:multidrug efflux pump subunit AcrB
MASPPRTRSKQEYAIVARRDHHPSRLDASADACHKRARPIIMTTPAMGACDVADRAGTGRSGIQACSPMSIGDRRDLLPTVLSPLVVLAVFTYVDDIGNWSQRMANKLKLAR